MRTVSPLSSREYSRLKRQQELEAQEAVARAERQREEKARQAEEDERRYQQWRFLLQYDAYFVPALQAWLGVPYRLDPMRNPSHAFELIAALARKKVSMSPPEYAEERYTVLLTAPVPQGWKVAKKSGDTLAEALTLSTWEIISNV